MSSTALLSGLTAFTIAAGSATARPGPYIPPAQVVARVDRFAITAADLLESYEFGPAFIKRGSDPLREHLEYMINERLLALHAERDRLDSTHFVMARVHAIEEDLAVDQLYYDDILARVRVSDAEIDTASEKARVRLGLTWLYVRTWDGAERLSRALSRGAPFDSLMKTMGEGLPPAERTTETTLLGLETNTPELAQSVARLKTGQISAPVRGPDGYYIVRLDRVWRNPLETESEQARLRGDAGRTLRDARARILGDEYVKTMMKAANPVIRAGGFNILRAYLAEQGLSRDMRLKWKIPATFMTEAGPRPISRAGEFLHATLVQFAGRTMTVKEYLDWFDIRQFQLRRTSLDAFNSSVKQTVWKMVQDRLLSERAYERGLQRRDAVHREAARWDAKLLYLATREQIRRSVTVSDSLVRQEFKSHRGRYRDTAGRPAGFEAVRSDIRRELAAQKENELLFRLLRRLRDEFPVTVDETAVRSLAAGLQPDRQAIDVMLYKPGGTFPRVAFPSIDERWQNLP
ncbi:MAG: peptidyl-prolyl cis-trans isomerase [Bacteroidota bacterium]